jgi:hypothetical protein
MAPLACGLRTARAHLVNPGRTSRPRAWSGYPCSKASGSTSAAIAIGVPSEVCIVMPYTRCNPPAFPAERCERPVRHPPVARRADRGGAGRLSRTLGA